MPRGAGPANDHLWVLEDEWRAWLAAATGPGSPVPAPAPLARRIARFHLVDNTRGEPPHWEPGELRSLELSAQAVEGRGIELRGSFHLETGDGTRGFEGQLFGSARLEGTGASAAVTEFELVALGDHWGEGRFTPGARPGRQPLGSVFTLADPEVPSNRVPPQGARWEEGYFAP
jgi:hypothetical protein